MTAFRLLIAAALPLLGVSCQNSPFGSSNNANDPYASYGTDGGYNPYGGATGGYAQPSQQAPTYPQYQAPASDPYAYDAPPSPPPASSSPAPSHSSGGSTHTVVRGDTLYSLSRRYGTTGNAIKSANGLGSDLLVIGQRLKIP